MAIDEQLNDRYRTALSGYKNISEKNMMGGTCFFHRGNMIGGCHIEKSGEKLFMFRVGKENEEKAMNMSGARPVVLGKRRMGGMMFVDADACDASLLDDWIMLTFEFVGALPAKP